MSLGDAAAALRLPVFPCASDKRPAIATGFHAASTDPARIVAMFERQGADMIGVPTGTLSGLIVIDIDIKAGAPGMEWLDLNREALPETRTHKTRSGGLHLVFLAPENVSIRNSASRVAPGVDVRGDGGYVIFPPSPGYSVADHTPPTHMPLWLIKACMQAEQVVTSRTAAPSCGSTKYGLAALTDECAAVRRAAPGTQEVTLNNAALKIGALVAGGQIIESVAHAELVAAGCAMTQAGAPWTHREVSDKVRRGMSDGSSRPRAPEPRHPAAASDQADAPAEPVDAQDSSPLPMVWFGDAVANIDAADFVEGLLIDGGSSVVYGASNSGKTFWVSDMALHIAAGHPWNGRAVEQGGVLWLAMEGAHGIANRVAAWRAYHGLDDYHLPFAYVPVALDLCNPDADTRMLIEAIAYAKARISVPLRLVVVDTLSRAMAGGNENSPEDMGSYVSNTTRIQQATGAHVTSIHHSGKDDAKGARGHSLLRAATDTEIEITAEGHIRNARVTKQRDLPNEGEFQFELKVVELGTNRRGKPVTSCVVSALAERAETVNSAVKRLSGHNQRAYALLADLIAASGKGGHSGTPSGVASVPEQWWRERFYEQAMPGSEQSAKQKGFKRAATELINMRLVGFAAGRVWLPNATGNTSNGVQDEQA